jgi:outer membrane protein
MMAKNKLLVVITICLLGVIGYLIFNHQVQRKVGYVYIKELYNGFEMKKQMEQKYLKSKQQRDKVLDSAKFELNNLLKKIDAEKEKNPKTIEEFNKKKEQFFQIKSSFEEENSKLSRDFDEQILTQLNQYVKDFGTQQHYDLLFGNDGNGSLMYAIDELNHTKEVLEFINAKYNGTK